MPSVSSPSYAPVARRNKTYRGGFRTSICALFSNPSRRADCCALSCCGVLQSDKNRYLLNGERPAWCKRVMLNFVMPFGVLIVMLVIGGILFIDSQNNQNQDEAALASWWTLLTWVAFIGIVVALCIRGAAIRSELRRDVMNRMYQERNETNEAEHRRFAPRGGDICCAQLACCGCYPNDVTYSLYDPHEDYDEHEEEDAKPDFCTLLFQNIGSLCCGVCCQSWCMFCGMCAIGQEERELSALVPKDQQMIDYMTFEPFIEYYPRIVELRQTMTESFWAHLRAVSKLSRKLLIALGIFFLIFTVLALTRVDKQFQFGNLLILIATFLQAFFILYFVHWRWHRFDLSFDAIVKFFSSGFLLGVSLALVYELVISSLFNVFMFFFVVIDMDVEMNGVQPADPTKWLIAYMHSHLWLLAIGAFFNAFVVAAVTEELCKYFSFWMVEHPDFLEAEDWNAISHNNEATIGKNGTNVQSLEESTKNRTLQSKGAAITIAMVTAALGFACCENLEYVLGSGGATGSIAKEAGTLVMRSFFPIHPLAAALQSIGVCRRDLEGDKSYGLGRIILPAVLLHGAFDFLLMLIGVIIYSRHIDEIMNTADKDSKTEIEETPADHRLEYLSLACGFLMVLVGIAVYVKGSRSQKRRLEELDSSAQSRHDEVSAVPLV